MGKKPEVRQNFTRTFGIFDAYWKELLRLSLRLSLRPSRHRVRNVTPSYLRHVPARRGMGLLLN